MNTFLIVVACMAVALSVVGSFMSARWAAPAAFVGLALAGLSEYIDLKPGSYIFWFVATMIVVIISVMLPKSVACARNGVGYIAGATLAGTLVGLCIGHAGMILGAVIGAFCGALAYSRTPSGKALGFPSRKSVNYLCAKGFPAVITMCMVGTVVAALTVAMQ